MIQTLKTWQITGEIKQEKYKIYVFQLNLLKEKYNCLNVTGCYSALHGRRKRKGVRMCQGLLLQARRSSGGGHICDFRRNSGVIVIQEQQKIQKTDTECKSLLHTTNWTILTRICGPISAAPFRKTMTTWAAVNVDKNVLQRLNQTSTAVHVQCRHSGVIISNHQQRQFSVSHQQRMCHISAYLLLWPAILDTLTYSSERLLLSAAFLVTSQEVTENLLLQQSDVFAYSLLLCPLHILQFLSVGHPTASADLDFLFCSVSSALLTFNLGSTEIPYSCSWRGASAAVLFVRE